MQRILSFSLPLALAVVLWSPARTQAGILMFTSGPTVKHLGHVVNKNALKDLDLKQMPDGFSVGYKYNYAGLFWIEFWTWGGTYCVYEDIRRTFPVTEEQAAALLGLEVKQLEKPFVYKYPPGLLVIAGLILLRLPFMIANRRGSNRMRALFADGGYRHALSIIDRHEARRQQELAQWEEAARQARLANQPISPKPAPPVMDVGFEEAVITLVREGYPREEVERNLRAMLAYRAEHQQQAE
jgi:hypothetical protein